MTFNDKKLSLIPFAAINCLLSNLAFADGATIDKIYHPYVDALEHELEYRVLVQDQQSDRISPAQIHKVSLGTSISDRWFGELYVVGEKSRDGHFDIDTYEIELKRQLTEQGEYFADWGVIFEYETVAGSDIDEFTIGLLSEKEWGRWSGTANLFLTQEWGDDIVDEFESVFALQTRYRYSALFEPGLEFYSGQTATGIGPVLQGTINTGIRKNVHWEAGLILGLDSKSPDQSFRFLMEFEF
tara:strand:- start:404 stop:1129 length:726 start_codon:yes stop_codon:yes gene_type:complete